MEPAKSGAPSREEKPHHATASNFHLKITLKKKKKRKLLCRKIALSLLSFLPADSLGFQGGTFDDAREPRVTLRERKRERVRETPDKTRTWFTFHS